MANRWLSGDVPRGADYDRRFEALAATGADMHGEATLVASYRPNRVLDAGCGTGRVAMELARQGIDVVGVDVDPSMLASARSKAPELTWVQGDLADPDLALGAFDVAVLAGNVLIFVAPETEGAVIAAMAAHLTPGGLLIAGYSLRPGGLTVERHDALAEAAGLELQDRWSTWDRTPFEAHSDYAVSVHRRAP
ncbi:MAG TPA: class I SAM-dependent methyltransferase [Acidimicrobiales bacterium]|jgi:SAM-dependent methyltransferase|nr:class I SAM-dependent methyltransferase [Acidimicrobiales bacterium]